MIRIVPGIHPTMLELPRVNPAEYQKSFMTDFPDFVGNAQHPDCLGCWPMHMMGRALHVTKRLLLMTHVVHVGFDDAEKIYVENPNRWVLFHRVHVDNPYYIPPNLTGMLKEACGIIGLPDTIEINISHAGGRHMQTHFHVHLLMRSPAERGTILMNTGFGTVIERIAPPR
jgi:hypothetical protein